MVLTLVKAGPSAWDLADRLAGSADVPLDSTADAVVRAIGGWFEGAPTMILHSAEEVSRGVAQRLEGVLSQRFPKEMDEAIRKEVEDLGEVGLGLWEGMRRQEVEQRFSGAYAQWKHDPWSVVPTDGEGMPDAEARLLGAILRGLGRSAAKTARVVVILRPLAWGAAVCALEDRPGTDFWELVDRPSRARLEEIRQGEKVETEDWVRRALVSKERLRKPRSAASRSA